VKHDNLAVFDRIKNGVVEASNIFAAHALFLRLLSLEWKLSNLLHGSLDGIGELRND
jgi:hypothetical protein